MAKKKPLCNCSRHSMCGGTGLISVANDGQFTTSTGRPLTGKRVAVLCDGYKGDRIRDNTENCSIPDYDPRTMRLPWQSMPTKQKSLF